MLLEAIALMQLAAPLAQQPSCGPPFSPPTMPFGIEGLHFQGLTRLEREYDRCFIESLRIYGLLVQSPILGLARYARLQSYLVPNRT